MKYSIEESNWNIAQNSYTLKDSIYRNRLHKQYKYSLSNINFTVTT